MFTDLKKIYKTDKLPAVSFISQAVAIGKLVFLAGQGPVDPETNQVIKGNIEEQTTQTLENIKTMLEEIGTSMDNVLKATVFLSDISNYDSMKKVYKRYFAKNPPARTCVQAGLAGGILIEIEVIALIPE